MSYEVFTKADSIRSAISSGTTLSFSFN